MLIRRTNGLVQYCFFTLLLCLPYSTLNNVAVLYLPHVSNMHQCQWAATTDLSFPVFMLLPQGQLSFCCPYDNVAIHIADLFFTLYISSSFCPLKRHNAFHNLHYHLNRYLYRDYYRDGYRYRRGRRHIRERCIEDNRTRGWRRVRAGPAGGRRDVDAPPVCIPSCWRERERWFAFANLCLNKS